MQQEIKTCAQCKSRFAIQPDDLAFYENIGVPVPTRCPRCRMIRRLGWHGQRVLYKRACDFTGDSVITFYHPDAPHKVYRQDVWWSDQWDPYDHGRDVDFSRPFFEQWGELFRDVPLPALHTEHSTMENSDYCNAAAHLKNCYLVFSAGDSTDSGYARGLNNCRDVFDATHVHSLELCHETVMVDKSAQVFASQYCDECHNVWFSQDLVGCTNCIGCCNLRGKSNYIFNKPVSKEEFERFVRELDLGSYEKRRAFERRALEFIASQPKKFYHGKRAIESTGDYLFDCKNVKDSYLVYGGENLRYCQLVEAASAANCLDYSGFGLQAEWIYESVWCGLSVNNVKFSFWNYFSHDLDYCFGCHSSGDLFGCVGVRKGEYAILNKRYSKEEYRALKARLIEHMKQTGEYGEFFPASLSPWAYNESRGHELAPLEKHEALAFGFSWREDDPRQYREATIALPDHIKDAGDDILKAILQCGECGKNYQIIRSELEFYRRFSIPIPRSCPLCRDRARLGLLNPIALFSRTCVKCQKGIETSYAPERPEVVYCESCYQNEVV